MTLAEVRAKRAAIRDLLEARGAANPRVFGSVVRDEADEKSDVDLVVDFHEPAPQGFAYFGALDQLQRELGGLLGTRVHVTVVDPSSPIGKKILDEALPL